MMIDQNSEALPVRNQPRLVNARAEQVIDTHQNLRSRLKVCYSEYYDDYPTIHH